MASFGLKDLAPLVLGLVLVGMILGIGILTLDKFGIVAKDATNVVNESVTTASNTVTLANDDVTALSAFANASQSFTVGTDVNFTAAGVITVAGSIVDGGYNASYTYSADSDTTTVLSNTISALSPIASEWMPLIVTVSILAIILGLVIGAFALRR